MEPQRIYEDPKACTEEEVFDTIERDDVERLLMIPIELGFHHENWRFIQEIGGRLSEHSDPRVRANALFGIEYAARFRGHLEPNIVKPVLLRALRDSDPDVRSRAEETIEAVNFLMGWNLVGAAGRKTSERRFRIRPHGQGGNAGPHPGSAPDPSQQPPIRASGSDSTDGS